MSQPPSSQLTSGRLFGSRERALAGMVFFPVLLVISLLPLRPPAVVDAGAPADEFSAARARAHLEKLAAEPHPIGAPGHAQVREYLIGQIEAMGLAAEVQTDTVTTRFSGLARVGRVRNVLTRLPGTAGKRALLLVAHYDTVPHSPGAGDDGSGVAVLLETLRAVKAGPAPRNDLIFLFSDGEERGLLGAEAFQRYHPWAAEVALALNFEARGSRGPSIMFETGPGTGALMSRFADLAPHPVAYSYSYDVYRRLPNDTDFTVFKRAGKPGFNFAYIGDVPAYHSSLDTLDRLDMSSVQHHGSYALALARGFGDAELADLPADGRRVYFAAPLLGLVVYPIGLALPLAAVAALLATAILVVGFRRRRLRVRPLLLGWISVVAVLIAAAGASFLLHQLLRMVWITGRKSVASPPLYLGALALVGLAVAVALLYLLGRKLGTLHLAAGAAIWWLLLALAAALYLPSSSYLSIWPLLFGLAGLWLLIRGSETPSLQTGASLLLLAVPVVVLWAPMVPLLGAALWIASGPILALIAALVASSLVPQVALLTAGRRGWLLPLALSVIGLGLAVIQSVSARHDAQRPRFNSILYALDSDAGTALWASWSRAGPDSWTSQFITSEAERRSISDYMAVRFEPLVNAAPVVDLPAPTVVDLDAPPDAEVGPGAAAPAAPRRLRLRVRSGSQAATRLVDLSSRSAITWLAVDGREVDLSSAPPAAAIPAGHWQGDFPGDWPEGFEIEVELAGDDPLKVVVVDRTYGLPRVPDFTWEPRPESLRPHPYRPTDLTLVRSAFVF